MLLNAVILVLQETLEAALLIGVLLSISRQQSRKTLWVPVSLAAGVLLAILYATQMSTISNWFEYQGQELVNAFLQILIALLITICCWAISYSQSGRGRAPGKIPGKTSKATIFITCATLAVALAIAREGTEILLYLSGFFQQNKLFHTILAGSLIGFGIGISIGILLYYSLQALSQKWRLPTTLLLLALFAGNMLSQAMLLLTQADWLTDTGALWDSSSWLAENSISGQLLYALVGYEASPSLWQVLAYSGGLLLILGFAYLGGRQSSRNNGPVG